MKRLENMISYCDLYGMPMTFSFKNSSAFKTSFGGLITIFTRMLIVAYLGYGISAVYDKTNKIVSKNIYKDMAKDKTNIILTPDNFDIAVSV